ncbi:hypothetical protein [Segetibacter koreensis]|uniref:hypothetical protein n=1 Tax=Segetibacter koreensis TaxID=398037 RepID=UPI000374A522|nr:hypothetical protein [Segetibacter koreensis]
MKLPLNKPLLFSLFLMFVTKFSIAQNDTSYYYFLKDGKEVSKDSSFYYLKLYKSDNEWFGREYYKKTNSIKSEGKYSGKDGKTPVGSFKNYKENGVLDFSAEYADGKLLSRTFFYKNGNKKSWITYNDKGADQQKGWDETGKEIRNYTVEKEARFKGGAEGWKKFLQKNINGNIAVDANAPIGTHEVTVQFIINKEGYVSNVKAVSVPAVCKPCGGEAVSVISNSPQWEPAIQNNEAVIYQAIQYVSFEVAEGSKKSKKSSLQ